MAEYLIQEETLVELADAVRSKYEYLDYAIQMISGRGNLTSISIPDSVTNIASDAFYECTSLINVTIPDSVTTIGNQAFIYCYYLANINIPNSVTNIGHGAFQGCFRLTDIYLNSTTPPNLGGADSTIPSTTTIHVPIGSGDAYRNATNWSSYANRIVEDITV